MRLHGLSNKSNFQAAKLVRDSIFIIDSGREEGFERVIVPVVKSQDNKIIGLRTGRRCFQNEKQVTCKSPTRFGIVLSAVTQNILVPTFKHE